MENESKGNDQTARNVAAVTNDDDSQVNEITDNNGTTADDYDEGASSQFGATGRKKRRTLGAITLSNRRIGKAVKIGKPVNFESRARAKIDTRADTVCAGSTFISHESTGKVVDVSGFHESFDTIKDTQVGACITAVDLESETIIACFHQSLYFGYGEFSDPTNSDVGLWYHRGCCSQTIQRQDISTWDTSSRSKCLYSFLPAWMYFVFLLTFTKAKRNI
jgi:hypothetical protein